jgi:hypothetical protein
MGRLLVVVMTLSLLTGCAFSPVRKVDPVQYLGSFVSDRPVPLGTQEALDAAKGAAEAMGYSTQSVTPELGQLRTAALQVQIPEVCDCGSWNLDPVRGTADSLLVVRVTAAAGGGSVVHVEHLCGTSFSGQNLYGATTRRDTYQCASRGLVEGRFLDTLTAIAAARTGGG